MQINTDGLNFVGATTDRTGPVQNIKVLAKGTIVEVLILQDLISKMTPTPNL